jgi:tetratricopeptide (TPR) repeat protein
MKPTDILKRGQELFFAKPPDFQKAKDFFQQVTVSAPGWVEGHHWLASACENLKDHSQAIKSYRQAIQCDPNDPRPRIALGRLLTFERHLKEAIAELRKGIELKPHYGEVDARLFLAEAYEKANDIPKAREQWKIVSEAAPSYPSYDKPMREALEKLKEYTNE